MEFMPKIVLDPKGLSPYNFYFRVCKSKHELCCPRGHNWEAGVATGSEYPELQNRSWGFIRSGQHFYEGGISGHTIGNNCRGVQPHKSWSHHDKKGRAFIGLVISGHLLHTRSCAQGFKTPCFSNEETRELCGIQSISPERSS